MQKNNRKRAFPYIYIFSFFKYITVCRKYKLLSQQGTECHKVSQNLPQIAIWRDSYSKVVLSAEKKCSDRLTGFFIAAYEMLQVNYFPSD